MKPSNDVVAQVRQHLSEGHFDQAVRMCDRELALSPSNLPLLALMAAACEYAGEIDRALGAAARWAEVAPLDPHAHYRLAALEQRRQNYAEARRRFELAGTLAWPQGDVAHSVSEALDTLDSIQLAQIIALREVDISFRLGLRADPARALAQRGFALDEDTFRRLIAADRRIEGGFSARPPRLC